MVISVDSHTDVFPCEVCDFSCKYKLTMPSFMIVQPALGCRDIPVEKFYFPLMGNKHFTHFMLWLFHLSSVISNLVSIGGVELGLEFLCNTLAFNHSSYLAALPYFL